jgi:hypothetical protein
MQLILHHPQGPKFETYDFFAHNSTADSLSAEQCSKEKTQNDFS